MGKKSDLVTVTLTKGKVGWSGKCEEDNHREVAYSSEGVLLKFQKHFRDEHPGKAPYVVI